MNGPPAARAWGTGHGPQRRGEALARDVGAVPFRMATGFELADLLGPATFPPCARFSMLSLFRKPERPRPFIKLEASGFSVTVRDKVVLYINWADVREVVAFKEDLFAHDEICVGFRTDETDSYPRVEEDFVHYEELLQELPRRFPGLRTDWFSDVAVPAFAPNWTTLWGESLRQRS